MAEMSHLIRAAHTASPLIQHTGGVEQLQQVNPQAGPPPAACPPHSAVPHAGPPVGPPIAVHEPAAGEHIVVPVVPNQPLTFEFNPLDLKATEQGQDITLTFPDGAQVTLHDIIGSYGPQPVPLELPDGTVITASELLQAFHLSLAGPCGVPALNEINPTAGPNVENTGFGVAPFDVGGIGPGLLPEGPLDPTGFGYTNEFVKGVGGSPPSPPGPPTPPGPPVGGFTVAEDTQLAVYTHPTPTPTISSDYFTDTNYGTGQPIFNISPSSPPVSVESYYGVVPAGPVVTPGTVAHGTYGDLLFAPPGTSGDYTYSITNFSGHGSVSQLATDVISEVIAQQGLDAIQGAIPLAVYKDEFAVTTTNGTDTESRDLNFFTFGAVAPAEAASATNATVPPTSSATMLLTYTDAVDPAHSFQQLVTVDPGTGQVHFTPESTTYVQPNDPALLTLQYVSGPSGESVTIPTLTIEGETINGITLGPAAHDAWSALINPNLGTGGTGQDPGDTGNASSVVASQDSGTTLTPSAPITDPDSNYTAAGYTGSIGYLDAAGSTATGAGNADTVNFNGTGGNITLIGSAVNNSTSVLEWQSGATIDSTDHFNGSTAAIQGLNVFEIESANSQTIDFTALSTSGVNPNFQNLQVFDLTDAANPTVSNSIVLTTQSVLNLAEHEPSAVLQFGNGAVSMFVLGDASDSVKLVNDGATNWTAISGSVTSSNPNDPATTPAASNIPNAPIANNATQMAGFTEYSANIAPTTINGETVNQVHVYVANAIAQNAGHVAHH